MQNCVLTAPDARYAAQIMDYRRAFLQQGDGFHGCGSLRDCETAETWLEQLRLMSSPETCPPGLVDSETWLGVDPEMDTLLGIIDFRHHIDHPILGLWGGHIGYSVHPDFRRRGVATQMLQQLLPKCRARGLERVLVTCDADHIASETVIRRCGGQYESTVDTPEGPVQRYWITL